MTTRQELDVRLQIIQEATVTDEEYNALTVPSSPTVSDYYTLCVQIITGRGDEGNSLVRLQALAMAKDNLTLDISGAETENNSEHCNVLMGAVLEN